MYNSINFNLYSGGRIKGRKGKEGDIYREERKNERERQRLLKVREKSESWR
jgi:hypothetical protein